MLRLSYAISPDLRENLRTIDALRTQILTTPLSPADELTLRWTAKVRNIQGSLALAGIKLPARDIEAHLSGEHTARPSVIKGYGNALNLIADEWVANISPVTQHTYDTIAQTVYVGPLIKHRTLQGSAHTSLRQLCGYLENQSEHAVIRAGIALGMLSGIILPKDDPGLAPRLLSLIYLARESYTLRGFAAFEHQWSEEASSYTLALSTVDTQAHLNQWLLFFAQSVQTQYAKIIQTLGTSTKRRASVLALLNDRQRAIVHLLDDPTASITNKIVQKRFRISQITASRDLAKLTTLGVLLSHGKGRSVSYTRI